MPTPSKDFGELIFRQHKGTSGVILARLSGLDSNEKAHLVLNAIKEHKNLLLQNFVVISKKME